MGRVSKKDGRPGVLGTSLFAAGATLLTAALLAGVAWAHPAVDQKKRQPTARVFFFETQSQFDAFVKSQWELDDDSVDVVQMSGRDAWAAGAVPLSPGVWLYTQTDEARSLPPPAPTRGTTMLAALSGVVHAIEESVHE